MFCRMSVFYNVSDKRTRVTNILNCVIKIKAELYLLIIYYYLCVLQVAVECVRL